MATNSGPGMTGIMWGWQPSPEWESALPSSIASRKLLLTIKNMHYTAEKKFAPEKSCSVFLSIIDRPLVEKSLSYPATSEPIIYKL